MNYIYDIYLNLNKTLYDFYEWNNSDNIIHIKRIPHFIVDDAILSSLVANDIKIDSNFIKAIHNKTELWSSVNKIPNCALFSDYDNTIAIEFDSNGNSIKKSFLSVDEEAEILEDINKNKLSIIKFKTVKKTPVSLKTRKQLSIDNFINNELKNINSKKLKYICMECLGTTEKNIYKNINSLKKLKSTSKDYKNLYDILKLTSKGTK